MRKTTAAALGLVAALAVWCQPARAQTPRPTPPPKAVNTDPASPRPDAGEVVGQTYTNKFFGLSLTFPGGWLILSDAGKEEIREGGKQFITGTPAEKAQLERALARTYNLFSLVESTTPQASQLPASLMCVAETLPVVNITAEQYLKIIRDVMMPRMKAQGLNYEVAEDIAAARIGGAEFSSLRFKVTAPAGAGWQEYHVAIRGGHVLGFILTYAAEPQRRAMRGALDSIKLTN